MPAWTSPWSVSAWPLAIAPTIAAQASRIASARSRTRTIESGARSMTPATPRCSCLARPDRACVRAVGLDDPPSKRARDSRAPQANFAASVAQRRISAIHGRRQHCPFLPRSETFVPSIAAFRRASADMRRRANSGMCKSGRRTRSTLERWLPLGGATAYGLISNKFGDTNMLVRKTSFIDLAGSRYRRTRRLAVSLTRRPGGYRDRRRARAALPVSSVGRLPRTGIRNPDCDASTLRALPA